MLASEQRSNSHSPSRGGLGSKISSLGAKLSRTFSNNNDVDEDSTHSGIPVLPKENRSLSRGREPLQSTGRGGFGNIRQASVSRDRPTSGPDDFSVTRGREPVSNPDAIYSTGRGGAGNLRSPSRDATRGPDPHEKEVIENYVAHQGDAPVSTGRGGLGNINRSRSRDPSRTRTVTTGRGGAGNFREGDGYDANAADELERKVVEGRHHAEGPHSTGRGGFANITEQEEPDLERPSISISQHGSTGRGGAGNIVRN